MDYFSLLSQLLITLIPLCQKLSAIMSEFAKNTVADMAINTHICSIYWNIIYYHRSVICKLVSECSAWHNLTYLTEIGQNWIDMNTFLFHIHDYN